MRYFTLDAVTMAYWNAEYTARDGQCGARDTQYTTDNV